MRKDLVVLVADQNARHTLRGILSRPERLGIRHIEFDIPVHPRRDPGVLKESGKFLSEFRDDFEFALALFDREGCGQERMSSADLQLIVQEQLDESGWRGRSAVVVLDPELDVWVWSASPHVREVLAATPEQISGARERFGSAESGKPKRPKEALEAVLRANGLPRSSSLYEDLASKVSFNRCVDVAFVRLKMTLREWFKERT